LAGEALGTSASRALDKEQFLRPMPTFLQRLFQALRQRRAKIGVVAAMLFGQGVNFGFEGRGVD
jgi:hypothetical protein